VKLICLWVLFNLSLLTLKNDNTNFIQKKWFLKLLHIYSPFPSPITTVYFCVFALGYLRLRLVPRKVGKCTAQHRILMGGAFAQWWLQNRTCAPGMPKAGNFANCWKR
jgi:hypothetical protein